jgi:paired amphipathic helix protein Sin3a
MGTTVQSITGTRALPDTAPGSSNAPYYNSQRQNWQQQPQHSIESPEAVFSTPVPGGGSAYNQAQSHSAYEAQQAAAHQQQRGVTQLTNAAATLGQPPRNAQTPTLGQGMNGAGAQAGMEKRGPVEFNHAISYVNKIKVSKVARK